MEFKRPCTRILSFVLDIVRIHGRKTHSDLTDLTKTLSPIPEKALVSWIKLLDSSLIQPTPKEIGSSANYRRS
jgi:hypothetical protein